MLEVTANEKLQEIINHIKPDVIHSFEMQDCSFPIVRAMYKFPTLKWIYSCWGSDLNFYKKFYFQKRKIKKVLKRIDYLITDCNRDFELAKDLGFKGRFLGVVPGGTGFKLDELEKYKIAVEHRKIILVKGYEHQFGRGLNIVKALQTIQNRLGNLELIVFGAHPIVIEYIKKHNLSFKYFSRHGLSHHELMKLMGESLIYIGNSISDGIPNTLLEAIVMGAYPIQSNPGDATSEIIEEGVNGFLIHDTENIVEISQSIIKIINNTELIKSAYEVNRRIAAELLEYEMNKQKIISLYKNIMNEKG